MSTIDDYILGNDLLHERFRVTTEVMGRIVSSTPESVTVHQLHELTGRPARELVKLCSSLAIAGLVQWDTQKHEAWHLACDPAETTLEDVFRCVLTEQLDWSARTGIKTEHFSRQYRDLDLLLMQMTMAINQSIFKHLRQFTLERLGMSIFGMFPLSQRSMSISEQENTSSQLLTAPTA